jgi:ribosomal protein L29
MNKFATMKELKEKSDKELQDLLKVTQADLSKARFQIAINKDKNVKTILHHRKQVARILTLLGERLSPSQGEAK